MRDLQKINHIRKQGLFKETVAIIIGLSIISGCGTCDLYRFKNDNKQWYVKCDNTLYNEFTIDDQGKLPIDKNVAKERYERRKDFVRKHHKIDHPVLRGVKTSLAIVLSPILFPILVVGPFIGPLLPSGSPDPEEIEAAQERKKLLREYIIEDMKVEREKEKLSTD